MDDGDRVLLAVDDEEDMRFLMQLYLRPLGYRVLTARDGIDALAELRQHAIDLVLLDLRMPRLDGWGVLEQMHDDPTLSTIPVIVLSAHASAETASEALAAGAIAFLHKPFAAQQLEEVLASTLDA